MTKILHLSDPHFGAADSRIADAFILRAAELAPDITILSGDLSMRARRREMNDARAFVDRLPQPRLIIPGNHDIPLINQPFDRFFRSFKRYQDVFGQDLEPEMATKGVHVVAVNSSRAFGFHADWSEGRLSSSQLSGVIRRFENSPGSDLRVLVLHHPLLELQIKGREVVKPLEQVLKTIETARVDLVLCGHFHRSQIHPAGITDKWRAVISQAPTVCSTRLQGEPQGFHEIHFGNDRMEMIHHVFQNGTFGEAGRFSFARHSSGWGPFS